MNAERDTPAPLLVLGVGNRLLRDDGVGLELLARVQQQCSGAEEIEFVDGGTQGLALLGLLAGRRAVLVLDAVRRGEPPGTIHELYITDADGPRATTAHESSVTELLAIGRLLGQLAPQVVIVGIEPDIVRTGIGLSPSVERSLDKAAAAAMDRLAALRRLEPAHA